MPTLQPDYLIVFFEIYGHLAPFWRTLSTFGAIFGLNDLKAWAKKEDCNSSMKKMCVIVTICSINCYLPPKFHKFWFAKLIPGLIGLHLTLRESAQSFVFCSGDISVENSTAHTFQRHLYSPQIFQRY